ncbi:M56 family metallopeptidase [Desulfitobacterium chlororespirans]|uniref:Signal transducer regulating beta-lactamase production, contains metallopeptidase domain n=1 Tax=Desulfitobacterium chlororespirans DSM 11544 TaxID=1121395 RepID=A0A1M7RW09_9FIRM|nr:M56 family metallopeptidase [Desulfitobacterium chlororespirans]SHN50356.1 Signal transducer regulating beta-lactamase production, contains metallopeptidase domain [Desulfitobacterium chlororespirans DSM 11544]
MTEAVLHFLLERTLTASLLIIALLVLRRIFRGKIPSVLLYASWLLVLIRLLIPIDIPSSASIMNLVKTSPVTAIEQNAIEPRFPSFESGLLTNPERQNETEPPNVSSEITIKQPVEEKGVKPTLFFLLFALWAGGALAVTTYMIILNKGFFNQLRQSSLELKSEQIPFYEELCRQVKIKTPLPVILSDKLPSPCLVGLFHPRIAVTPEATASTTILRHTLLHELCHYKQKDNLFTLLRNICCAVYWFNPFVWAAALASREDSELSCDARVLRYLDECESLEYGETLLTLLNTRNTKTPILNTATAMASGKSTIGTRISLIIKPSKKLKTASVFVCGVMILFGMVTLTDAKNEPVFGQQNTPHVQEAIAKNSLDIDTLKMLANGQLTLADIPKQYVPNTVTEDKASAYTLWTYTLDNDFSFDVKYISEPNLPPRYTASLRQNKGSNYIFFPCRPESLDQYLAACARGDLFQLQTYASFDGEKMAEIEYRTETNYEETKDQTASVSFFAGNNKTYALSNKYNSFGRVIWSPDSVYGAFINMITLNGTEGRDNGLYLFDSLNREIYDPIPSKTLISAFNESGTINEKITTIYLEPQIKWSPDSTKLSLTCYPASSDNHVAAHVVYDIVKHQVENIVIKENIQAPSSDLSY